ncbi:hypothetical protein JHK82_017915 [Glycine max]|nr:hypothetical protein JHK82_017915 [Glycine max]
MKGTSKFIMGATLVMVVSLVIVLGLILVLLAELYCSLLLRRRQLRKKTNTIPISTTQTTTTIPNSSPSHTPQHSPSPPPPPFSNVYSQGVLQAPRSFLFPCKDEPNATPRGIGLVSVSSSPLASFLARAPPQSLLQVGASDNESPCVDNNKYSCGGVEQHLVYISNPIYENGSSGEDDAQGSPPPSLTPPLTPMKKLPAQGSSVSLRGATSLGTSGSGGAPCTSSSW